ncbi:MAG: hypothetical protein ACPHWZ_03015 [Longimicrobiales bacterium]
MNDERRFTDDEVARILDDAAEAQASGGALMSGSTGLTLGQLKEIAVEAGISETAVERAVAKLDAPAPLPTPVQKHLGQTIGVGRSVDLPRRLTDEEWHELVVDLRQTFDAKGKLGDEGPFRQWTNGNLQALLEPTGVGERLRLKTLKGSARSYQSVGAAFMGMTGLLGFAQMLGRAGDPSDLLLFGIMGAGFFLGSRLTVPAWARTRAAQFEEVIERLQHRIASRSAAELTDGE